MAISTALLAKVLAGFGVVAAATVTGVVLTKNKPKAVDTQEKPSTPEENLKALNEKIKSLGITGCELVNGQTKTQECSLDATKIKAIKFEGKSGETLSPESASLTLTIEKGYESLDFPEGLRFSFTNSNTNDITIGDASNQITFKSNTTYDYKIKTEGGVSKLAKAIDLTDLLNKVGLTCGSDTAEECSLGTGSVNVWKGRNSYKTGVGSDPTSIKKIKVSRDSAGYRQGIKFYVDEETTLKTSDNASKDYPLNKETSYEIDIRDIEGVLGNKKQIVKKWFLVDKSTAKLNEKIKALGITDCELEEGKAKKENCTLNAEKIKKIKFDGKEGETLSPDNNASLTLTIERDHLGTEFPLGLRFTFTNSSESDVTIGNGSSPITLKQGVNYDYKMKTDDNTKLEKAWKLTTLAAKVGLTCTDNATDCTLPTTGINVLKSETDYITGATQTDSNKKMTVTKDQKGYLEGFKFTLKDKGDITLNAGTKKKDNDGIDKLTKTNMNYGIDAKDIDGIKTWFLIEKATIAG